MADQVPAPSNSPIKPMTIGKFRNSPYKKTKKPTEGSADSQPIGRTIGYISKRPRNSLRPMCLGGVPVKPEPVPKHLQTINPGFSAAVNGQKNRHLMDSSRLRGILAKDVLATGNLSPLGVNRPDETGDQNRTTSSQTLHPVSFVSLSSLRPSSTVMTNSDPLSSTRPVLPSQQMVGESISQGMTDPLESVQIGVSQLTARVWRERRLQSGCRTDDEFAWKLLRAEANFEASNRFLASLASDPADNIYKDSRGRHRYGVASSRQDVILEACETASGRDILATSDASDMEPSGHVSVCRFHRQYSSSVSMLFTALDDLRHCIKCGTKFTRPLLHKSELLYALVCRRGHVQHVTKEMAIGFKQHRTSSSRGCTLCDLWRCNDQNIGELLSEFVNSTSNRRVVRISESAATEYHDQQEELLSPEPPQPIKSVEATISKTNDPGPVRIIRVSPGVQATRRLSSRKLISHKRTCFVPPLDRSGAQSILRKRDDPPPERPLETTEDRPMQMSHPTTTTTPNLGIAVESCFPTNGTVELSRTVSTRLAARRVPFASSTKSSSGGVDSPEATDTRPPAPTKTVQVSLLRSSNTGSGGKLTQVSCAAQVGQTNVASRFRFVDVAMPGEVTDSNGNDPRSTEASSSKRFKSILKSRPEYKRIKYAFTVLDKWGMNGAEDAEYDEPVESAVGDATGSSSSFVKLEPGSEVDKSFDVASTGATYEDRDQLKDTSGDESILCPIIKLETNDDHVELDISDISQGEMDEIVKMNDRNI